MVRGPRSDAEYVELARLAPRHGPREPRAARAWYSDGVVWMLFHNGTTFGFPRAMGRGLENATPEQLAKVEVEQDGESLHWEDLDADISVPGILAESLGLVTWAPALLGAKRSEAKARAARENGRKGGRPKKKPAH